MDSTIRSRRLRPADQPAALALSRAAGVHGLYVQNVLLAHPRLGSHAVMLAFERAGQLQGVAHFGSRGNLLVLEAAAGVLDPASTAAAILESRFAWRIALAPDDIVDALVAAGRMRTLVNRRQMYYAVTADELACSEVDPEVRQADKKDLEPLMQAALHLNQTDLMVEPWCVDRDWLKRSTKGRIKRRTTHVIGPIGEPTCKLDLGSEGPAGVVIEGVYTWPELRGRGLASRLVRSVARRLLDAYPVVSLHVAADNTAARRSYEKCGMRVAGSCRLMLRG